jgi:hypothetical protein
MINQQKMVAMHIVFVEIAAEARHLMRRLRAHFFIKSFVTKLLGVIDVRRVIG